MNGNKIVDLVSFVTMIKQSCPSLMWLSMLNNEACSNYFSQCSLQKFSPYRLYVIARIKTLKTLDGTRITDEEWGRAQAEGLKYACLNPLCLSACVSVRMCACVRLCVCVCAGGANTKVMKAGGATHRGQ